MPQPEMMDWDRNMWNTVVLRGRLGADPVITVLENGTRLAKARLAVQKPKQPDSTADPGADWCGTASCLDSRRRFKDY